MLLELTDSPMHKLELFSQIDFEMVCGLVWLIQNVCAEVVDLLLANNLPAFFVFILLPSIF